MTYHTGGMSMKDKMKKVRAGKKGGKAKKGGGKMVSFTTKSGKKVSFKPKKK
jgi:general stress protein YciG